MLLGLLALALAAPEDAARTPAPEWEVEAWEQLYDARLGASLGQSPTDSIAAYNNVLDRVPDDQSPVWSEAHFWLAFSLFQASLLTDARRELDRLAELHPLEVRERALRSRIEAQERQITRLPFSQSFETTSAPWIRSWVRSGPDDLRLTDQSNGNRAVSWSPSADFGQDDFLYLRFRDARAGPQRIQMRLRAEQATARVRFVLEDDDGQQWNGKVQTVPMDRWVSIDLSLSDFDLVGDPRSGREPDPARIRILMLFDVTRFRTTDAPPHHLLIDDLEIR